MVVFRDRPPPVQRRGRCIHPYDTILKAEVIAASEEIRPIHRARCSNPYAIFHAVNPTIGAARLLLTLRWTSSDPVARAIQLAEAIPDDSLPVEVRERLRKLALP